MKLVTTALEWSYVAEETDVKGETLKKAAELLVLCRDTLWIIDGDGSDVLVEGRDGAKPTSANGKEPEPETVQESKQQNTTETVETTNEQVQTSTSPNCPFSRTVIPIDLKRWTDSSITSAECPLCGRTRSLSPSKGVLRFPPHTRRKIQTPVSD